MTSPVLPALAISGSGGPDTPSFRVAVATTAGVHASATAASDRTDLLVLVQQVCAAAALPLAAVREVRVDLGPGSYTGLRVAVTCARFVHHFAGAALWSTTSLAMQALAAALPGRTVRPVLDGRRGRMHTAVYRAEHATAPLQQLRAPAALDGDELGRELAAGEVVLAPPALQALLHAAVTACGAELREPTIPTAALLFDPRLPLSACTAAELEPLYLMGSYAE